MISNQKNYISALKQSDKIGEYQEEVLNLVLKQTENRLGMLEVLYIYTLTVTKTTLSYIESTIKGPTKTQKNILFVPSGKGLIRFFLDFF